MKIHRYFLAACLLAFAGSLHAEKDIMEWYLPWSADYDESIPTPESVLGYEPGEWHVSHDQQIRYFERLAASSDRVSLVEKERTYEQRPMLVVKISASENQSRLDEIREERLAALEPGSDADLSEQPVVNWLGYSIHGDEASGANAALVVAWHLAAAQDDKTRALLDDSIILIEPAMNPDGVQRFASWVNSHRGHTLVGDPQNREHRQAWPRARTNHYWFDLNRDWLPVQHPESRARVAGFHHWKPNVVGDWHEMGRNSTYFFQPGDPERNNPRTPERNYELTADIAEYHGRILDEHGETYFTKEVFDDYYYGKGSTFPDINAAVGILYEQGSARGHLRETIYGERSFKDAVRNQVLTSFSTLEAAYEMREELLSFQREFFEDALEEASGDRRKAFVIGEPGDQARTAELVEILLRQDVEVRPLGSSIEADGQRFNPGEAWVIPLEQPQYRFILAMMERQLEFPSTRFYDVSTWTLPLSFNMPIAELSARQLRQVDAGEPLTQAPDFGGMADLSSDKPVAWAFDWEPYYAPRMTQRLLEAGARLHVATEPFESPIGDGETRRFDRGSIMIPVGMQEDGVAEKVESIIRRNWARDGVSVSSIQGGLSRDGVDLGSRSFQPVEKVRPMILVDDGVNMQEAGEIWHLLDFRYEIPVSLVNRDEVSSADLDRYTHIFMVNGNWSGFSEEAEKALHEWVREGGTLVAQKSAVEWVSDTGLYELEFRERDQGEETRKPYEAFSQDIAAQVIGGSIFEAELDLSHPMAYGYARESLPIFRNSTRFVEPVENPYVQVARYTDEPLLSGYVSDENLELAGGSVPVLADRVGSGSVVLFVDNPSFRAFWFGTNRLLLNSLFFSEAFGHTRRP
ncbi:hypothetical protein J2T60_000443 [Natronospira proteinivora]|uniref:Peptidase M14 domain-containing protein n=1 Tax=Natronospira proteinivora TaxID=1807133 RepID=A0ABT1G5A3_9GAMM|nr:M14 metallopeptidase family protein [Natronospira proteinivora]MCP1726478.1 hypothetical protein [Natronospira proteinivora]